MIHKAFRGSFTFAILLGFSSLSSAAHDPGRIDTIKAHACIDWLVNGEPYIRTAQAIRAGEASPRSVQQDFPLPYILANLGLANWTPEAWRQVAQVVSQPRLIYSSGISASGATQETAIPVADQGTPFVSLGEGRSGLIPFVIQNGMKAYGVDPRNDVETGTLDGYLGKYFMESLPGDARDLSKFADQSQQLVASHMLLPYLTREDRLTVLRESFRLLKPRGTARHSILVPYAQAVLGDSTELVHKYESMVVEAISALVKDALGDSGYQVAVFIDEPRMRLKSAATPEVGQLIDTDVFSSTLDDLRSEVKPLEAKGLNILVVLRRPDSAFFSWESWFGK